MTSDAKIGLLLGLFFIFLISFIINGLPKFSSGENGNHLTTNMVNGNNSPSVIEAKQRQIVREISFTPQTEISQPPLNEEPLQVSQEIRYETDLANLEPKQEKLQIKKETIVKEVKIAKKQQKESQTNKPQLYVIQKNDNLAKIAKKFYGEQAGNKNENLTKIFEANKSRLKTMDQIYEGQKIVIPSIEESVVQRTMQLPSSLFEKVDSIGQRHLINEKRKNQVRFYMVKEGDSLWNISEKMLGNGSRYKEIVKLNAGNLNDEDMLKIDARLKIPAK